MMFSYVLYFNHAYNTCTKQRVAKAWSIVCTCSRYSLFCVLCVVPFSYRQKVVQFFPGSIFCMTMGGVTVEESQYSTSTGFISTSAPITFKQSSILKQKAEANEQRTTMNRDGDQQGVDGRTCCDVCCKLYYYSRHIIVSQACHVTFPRVSVRVYGGI